MSREADIRSARDLIWRNLPGFPTTFGPCSICGGSGRGGGPCLQCGINRLAKFIGRQDAERYASAVIHVRELEKSHK